MCKLALKSRGLYSHNTHIRVRYAETDKMGYVYYGNYATYLEVGRVEMLRSLGVSYKSLEDSGILLPVVNYSIDYKKAAYYDDELVVVTQIKVMPSVRIVFHYNIMRGEELLSSAETTLVFLDQVSGRPTKCPPEILDSLSHHF